MIATLLRRRKALAVRTTALQPPSDLDRATRAVSDLIKEADDRVETLLKRLREREEAKK